MKLTIHPLTAERWDDFEKLFGPRGACGGCWCMAPRLARPAFKEQQGEPNRKAFQKIVQRGPAPGVIGYAGKEPAGWCAIAPRGEYSTLARSRVLAPLDAEPVWSIVCLFIAKDFRRQGVSTKMIAGAAKFAKSQGAKIVEAYPVVPKNDAMPPVFAWTGILSAYLAAGFSEAARRSPSRPIVRRKV